MMMETYENEENYEQLASAIVLQAVDDYRHALRVLSKNPKRLKLLDKKKILAEKKALEDIPEIEKFFRSDWYRELSKIDPELIVQGLNNEAKILPQLPLEINLEEPRGNMARYRAIVADYEAGMALKTIADRRNYAATSGVSLALKRAEKAGIEIVWRRPRHERKM